MSQENWPGIIDQSFRKTLIEEGYSFCSDGQWTIILNSDESEQFENILSWLTDLREQFSRNHQKRGHRHRKCKNPIDLSTGTDWFVKQYHHGGLLAKSDDVLYESPDRFLAELLAYENAKNAGIVVPEPVGAAFLEQKNQYEGFYFSRVIRAQKFTKQLREKQSVSLCYQAGECLAKLHDSGLDHQDFHVNNLLVDDENRIVPVDFDPVQFTHLSQFTRELRLQRFRRSLRKYGFIEEDERQFLEGYRERTNPGNRFLEASMSSIFKLKGSLSDFRYWARNRSLEEVDLEKILIRAPNWLGDAVMSLSMIQYIAKESPQTQIDVVCRQKVAPVYESHQNIKNVHNLDNAKTFRLPETIRKERYSSIILIPKSLRTGIQAFFSSIPRRIGFNTQLRNFMLTDRVSLQDFDRSMHHARLNYRLIKKYLDTPDEISLPRIHLPAKNELNSDSFQELDSYVVFHPGSAYGKAKRWPPTKFARLLDRIGNQYECPIVAVGVEKEQSLTSVILDKLNYKNYHNYVGRTTLHEVMEILDQAHVTVANDSGIMHLSAALETPTVGIFGSSDPELTRPLGKETKYIYEGVECSPCFERECPREEDRYKCLEKITVEEVFQTFSELYEFS